MSVIAGHLKMLDAELRAGLGQCDDLLTQNRAWLETTVSDTKKQLRYARTLSFPCPATCSGQLTPPESVARGLNHGALL